MINTAVSMNIDLNSRRPLLANKTGSLSGPAIKTIAIAMLYKVYEAVNIPIIGVGGISSPEDVIEFMLAGASAVQVGMYNFVNPYACRDIINQLPSVMEKYGFSNIKDITGGAHE